MDAKLREVLEDLGVVQMSLGVYLTYLERRLDETENGVLHEWYRSELLRARKLYNRAVSKRIKLIKREADKC